MMSNQPDEPQGEQSFRDALLGKDEDIDDETAEKVLAAYGIEPKDLTNGFIRRLISELQKSYAVNHELGKSLMLMSEKYQAMAGERDELQKDVEVLKAAVQAEVDEFNAGYQAAQEGKDLDIAESEWKLTLPEGAQNFDVFGCGYAWAAFEGLRAQAAKMTRERDGLAGGVERLQAEQEQFRQAGESFYARQLEARQADACTECKGMGEIGYVNETELGPEGDSSECDACFGSGSQAMADRISAFIKSEQAPLTGLCQRVVTATEIPRDEFEGEIAYLERIITTVRQQLSEGSFQKVESSKT